MCELVVVEFNPPDAFGIPSFLNAGPDLAGNFVWDKNIRPQYFWYNGTIDAITAKDAIDPSKRVALNWPVGSPTDPHSRIAPFKVHTGKQPYDTVNKTMLIPHLFGPPDSDAYWSKYDWNLALEGGMKKAGLPYSGQFGFLETSYVFPTTHMVAPKENSVSCDQCHTPKNGRMASISGVYMPGRDGNRPIEILGWTATLVLWAGYSCMDWGELSADARRMIDP